MEDATYCPFCDRSLESAQTPLGRRAAAPTQATRTLLGVGVVFFAAVAFACLVAAFVI